MNKQSLLDALHAIQLWGIVGPSRDPSRGKGRCGSNDEFLEAYGALEGEVIRLISECKELNIENWELKAENGKLTERCNRLLDKTVEMADEYARLKESLAESEREGSMAWDRTRKVEAENESLRKVANLCAEYIGDGRCEGCVVKSACNNGDIDCCYTRVRLICMMQKLGIEVK